MNKAEFSKYTEKIRSSLPFWFKMKKKPNDSVGLNFLNIFGMELNDIEKMLDYAINQYYIDSADIYMIDIVYKVNLPVNININQITSVNAGKDFLIKVNNLYEFFGIEDRINNITHAYNQNNIYFIDEENKIIYVREPYNKSIEKPNGFIYIKYGEENRVYDLLMHHVWNFFDEFGALVGCKRLKGEGNLNYKDRILDVFKNPANSTKLGLANGIARGLDLRKKCIWEDMSKDFIIKDSMVILDTIKVNGVIQEDLYITDTGYIVLKGITYLENVKAEVEYISDFSIEPLIEKHINTSLSNELYYADNSPTNTFYNYISKVQKEASIIWNEFEYDNVMWVKDDDYENLFSFIPSRLDAKIGGFSKYGFVE